MKEKTLFDFMRKEKKFEFEDSDGNVNKLIMESGNLFFTVGKTKKMYQIKDRVDLLEYYQKDTGLEIRICNVCGSPMQEGYTCDGGIFYVCSDECFKKSMDDEYGEGNWRANETGKENEFGGYYEYLEEDGTWQPEPSYYIDWY